MIIILKQDDIGINHATRKRNCWYIKMWAKKILVVWEGNPNLGGWVGGGHNMLCNDKDYGDATY